MLTPPFSETVTLAAYKTTSWIAFWLTFAMMVAVITYIAYTKKRRTGTFWFVNGPLIMVCVASILVIVCIYTFFDVFCVF